MILNFDFLAILGLCCLNLPKALKLQGLNKALVKALVIFDRKFCPWPSLRASITCISLHHCIFSSSTTDNGKSAMGDVLPWNWRRPVRRP
ncbi:hypothetical protein C8R45DRAFT_1029923 [Mycena sanguinolenta]|nr:hypothetical protein C8R45DRAFT_1029923 [Mycena sanguinolenta]